MVHKLIRKIASEIKYDYYKLAGYEFITGNELFTCLFGEKDAGQYKALVRSLENKLDKVTNEGIIMLDQYIEILESKLKEEYRGGKVGKINNKVIGFITPTHQRIIEGIKRKIDKRLKLPKKK